MFGYLNINQPELKIKDFTTYQACYCGLCKNLKKSYGISGQLTLTYDLTFLVLLLTGLYEPKSLKNKQFCPLHPLHKRPVLSNWCSEYSADMNLLSAYYQFQDDYNDEHKFRGRLGKTLYQKDFRKLKQKYPDKIKKMEYALTLLRKAEQEKETNIDKVAGYSGEIIAEIFVPKEDVWKDSLYQTGFYLGKFLYLMDAYEDLDKDEKSGCYNPLLPLRENSDFEQTCAQYLNSTIAECAKSFEKLPIVDCIDILRNILYSGIWSKYEAIHQVKDK